jgi:hypothetical protein
MIIKPIDNTTFKYHHPLKTAWLKGELPSVKKGIYGVELTKKNVSIEHIIPVSKGGKTILGNIFLADKKLNNARGVEPIEDYITPAMLKNYLKQFINLKTKTFDGNEYIREIKNSFEKMLDL